MTTDFIALAERVERANWPSRRIDDDIAATLGVPLETYTSNIDTAATLVPINWRWSVDSDNNATLQRHPNTLHIHASTPALALCGAAIRAMAEEAKNAQH